MSASKKIKDCPDCQKYLQGELSRCEDWEAKRKEILENKIQNEPCLNGIIERRNQLDEPDPKGTTLYDYGHLGSIEKALEKYKVIKNIAGLETLRACTNCGKYWARNEYGDETGDSSFADRDVYIKHCDNCQTQTTQSANQIKYRTVQIPKILSKLTISPGF